MNDFLHAWITNVHTISTRENNERTTGCKSVNRAANRGLQFIQAGSVHVHGGELDVNSVILRGIFFFFVGGVFAEE
ncbi:hypothetical protein LguiA_015965 [Lonicera macranthoides]